MTLRSLPLLAFGLLLLVAGCDSAEPADAALQTDTEDTALVVAQALALDAGGVLDVAAEASAHAATPRGGLPPALPGCRPTRTFDEAAVLYTITADCSRSNGTVSASYARVSTVQFLAESAPQPGRDGATSMRTAILSGSSSFRTPRHSHSLTSLTSAFTVTDLNERLVTVNGTYARAATDTLRAPRGTRTHLHTLTLALADVRGPRGVEERWAQAVSGRMTGLYTATVTTAPAEGEPTTRTITREIDVTFPRGQSRAQIAVGGRRFEMDRATGAVVGLD